MVNLSNITFHWLQQRFYKKVFLSVPLFICQNRWTQ
jgi:hypothetical protein